MDIKVSSCILLLEGKVVAAGHDGYCSGGDCDDIEVVEHHCVTLEYYSDEVIENLKYLESINALDDIFCSAIGFSYKMYGLNEGDYHPHSWGGQSGYCGSSESGRHHEADFTATKVLGVLDINSPGINIDPYWNTAEINERGLEKYVGLLQNE